MRRIRQALFIVGLLTVGSSLVGCAVYTRPGYGNRWQFEHRGGRRW